MMIHTPINIVKVVSLAKVYEKKYNSTTKPQKTQNQNTQYQYRSPFNSNKLDINQKPLNPPLL